MLVVFLNTKEQMKKIKYYISGIIVPFADVRFLSCHMFHFLCCYFLLQQLHIKTSMKEYILLLYFSSGVGEREISPVPLLSSCGRTNNKINVKQINRRKRN